MEPDHSVAASLAVLANSQATGAAAAVNTTTAKTDRNRAPQ